MRFAIELDGVQHFREYQKEYDQNRTFYLEMKKIKVIRFESYFIFHNLQEVLQKISEEIESSSSKSPLLA